MEKGDVKARLDGKISSLLQSMDATGIEKAVVCSIATKPEQFLPILEWSRRIASERIIPFPSIYPEDPAGRRRNVKTIKDEGFRGIKLHPYYQQFDVDEKRMFPIYPAIEQTGLIFLCHGGFDLSFPLQRKADP